METNEQALLAVLADHLAVTEKLLEHYIKLTQVVQQSSGSLVFEQHPTLAELHSSTRLMQQRVRAILEPK